MSPILEDVDPETRAIQQQFLPASQQVQWEIEKWVKAANLDFQVTKCLISPSKDNLLVVLKTNEGDRAYLSLTLLSWDDNIWKGTYARIHSHKLPFPIHGFYTPSTPLKSYFTKSDLPPLFINLYDYLTKKYLQPKRGLFPGRMSIPKQDSASMAWVPGMDDISTFFRSELTKTYPNVPRSSILGRRAQKKSGRRNFVLNLVDTLRLSQMQDATMVEQDFILEFDIRRVSIPLARNSTFNIVAFIVHETLRVLSEVEKRGLKPNIEQHLGQERFKCQWCNYSDTSIIRVDTDPKFVSPSLVFEVEIACPKCHEKSRTIFSSEEQKIPQDAHRRILICEKCGKDGLQIVGKKVSLGKGIQLKITCPSCGNIASRFLVRSFCL